MKLQDIHVGMRVKLNHNHTKNGIKYTFFPVGSIGVVYDFIAERSDSILVRFDDAIQLIHICDISPVKREDEGAMTANEIKALVCRKSCLLYFGANRKAFLTALAALRDDYDMIVENSLRELETYDGVPQYTIEVRNGWWAGWNVVNSEQFYGERYWEGQSKIGLPVIDLSRQKAVIV